MSTPKKNLEPSSGLPTPQVLKEYDQIVPGSADRLMKAFEDLIKHRIELEKEAQKARIADVARGQLFGLLIGLAAILGGSVAASLGSQWAGSAIGGGGVLG